MNLSTERDQRRGRTEQEQMRGQNRKRRREGQTERDARTDRTGTDVQTDRQKETHRQTEADAWTEQEETHRWTDRKRRADGQNRLAAKRQGHRGEKNWESEMSRWKRSHTGWRKKEVPLYSARSYIRCPVINHRGQECKIKNVYMCLMSHFSVLQRPARHCKSTILP